LSFKEFIELGEFENISQEEVFQKYIKFGGLPGLFHLDFHPSATFQFLDAIYQTILLKDIVRRHKVRNVDLLDNHPKYVISMDSLLTKRISGVIHINLYDFLLKGLIVN
jgi:uncharacterized protein